MCHLYIKNLINRGVKAGYEKQRQRAEQYGCNVQRDL